ncbi:hypothetical protein AB0M10_15105 [Streptomyces sp. NPDC051840]|uniref:hypothetical protein n=1 Tax=Streptomyces sp. NPDC051840 TaxID=3154752 RepID=UPI0034310248
MALQLSQTCTCDWHAVLPNAAKVEATAERLNPKGTLNDLCENCALLFDLIVPRLDSLLPFLQPDTLQQLFRVGRPASVEEEPSGAPAQLALTGPPASPAPAKKAGKSRSAKGPKYGAWREDVAQVMCPEPHRVGSAQPFWVDVSKRGGHARSSHRTYGPEIDYRLQSGLAYKVFCNDHALCVKAGGFGFLDEQALQIHRTKSKHWDPAPK